MQIHLVTIEYSGNPPDPTQVYAFQSESEANKFEAALDARVGEFEDKGETDVTVVTSYSLDILTEAPDVTTVPGLEAYSEEDDDEEVSQSA